MTSSVAVLHAAIISACSLGHPRNVKAQAIVIRDVLTATKSGTPQLLNDLHLIIVNEGELPKS